MKWLLRKLLPARETKEEAKISLSPFRPRSPRVRLALLDSARFELGDGTSFPLRNLSETGFAVGEAGGGAPPQESKGRLKVGGEEIPVEFRVVWRTEREAGGYFQGATDAVRGLLRRVFAEELKATEMSEVSPSHTGQA